MTREEAKKTASRLEHLEELERLMDDLDELDVESEPVEALQYVLQEQLYDGDALDEQARRLIAELKAKTRADAEAVAAELGFTYERPDRDEEDEQEGCEAETGEALPAVGEMIQVPA